MNIKHFCYSRISFFIIVVSLLVVGCKWSSDDDTFKKYNPGAYKMIEVPIPQGGLTTPIGFWDETTAKIDNAFYLGETEVTFGLWQAVAYWATFDKKGESYNYIYWKNHSYLTSDHVDYPINGVTYIQALVWCNAYTEWHNERYKTKYSPVYVDETGKPIRTAKIPLPPTEYDFRDLEAYIKYYPMMHNYFDNIQTTGNGFRLPTPFEWELAARWRGNDNTNTVTETVNDFDFASQLIKFTKGNSASGAPNDSPNESHKYAVFDYNSKGKQNPFLPKTRLPNALNIYDMSGNLREYTYYVVYQSLRGDDYPFAVTKGGYFEDQRSWIASGGYILVDVAAYNYFYGVRLARNNE